MQARDAQDYTMLSRSAPSRRGSPGPLFVDDRKIVVRCGVNPAGFWFIRLNLPESAASERAPHEQADLFGLQQGNDFPFEIAAGDRVISLKRVESGQVPEPQMPSALAMPMLASWSSRCSGPFPCCTKVSRARSVSSTGVTDQAAMDLVQIDMIVCGTAETGLHRP